MHKVLRKIHRSCARWPHVFLADKSPEQWSKLFVEKLTALVLAAMSIDNFPALVAFFQRRDTDRIALDDIAAAREWQNGKISSRRRQRS
ncbi:hypothetical protein ACHAQK_012228 [Fusarium lateritium]